MKNISSLLKKNLQKKIESLAKIETVEVLRKTPEAYAVFADLLNYLNRGAVHAAEPLKNGKWRVNSWVRDGIVRVGFRLGQIKNISKNNETLQFLDKDTLPLQDISTFVKRNIRIVPGGVSIRAGSYIGDNCIIMPPSYINIGAYIGNDTMVDSLALVGSCAQIGKKVHIAAGAIVGGVLEPANAKPCIVGDNTFVGAYSGIFNGVELGTGVVLAAKTVITESTEVWEALPGKKQRPLLNSSDNPIKIPDYALVIPGSRQLLDEKNNPSPLSKNIAIIRGYYPKGGNGKLALTKLLRGS